LNFVRAISLNESKNKGTRNLGQKYFSVEVGGERTHKRFGTEAIDKNEKEDQNTKLQQRVW
jgi:hypothetical protein